MSAIAAPGVPFLRSKELALACALTDARREAAQALRVRYVAADAAGGWTLCPARPRMRRECYRVFPGGYGEHHPAPGPRRRR